MTEPAKAQKWNALCSINPVLTDVLMECVLVVLVNVCLLTGVRLQPLIDVSTTACAWQIVNLAAEISNLTKLFHLALQNLPVFVTLNRKSPA